MYVSALWQDMTYSAFTLVAPARYGTVRYVISARLQKIALSLQQPAIRGLSMRVF